jgi:hypothetical protein
MTWFRECYTFLAEDSNRASAVAAMGSALAAILAVIVSTITLWHQRKHDRLTVRPLAYIQVGDYTHRVFVKVVNNGTGPMIIKSIANNDQAQPLYKMLPLPYGVYWTHYVSDTSNRSVPAGGEIVLVDLSSKSNEHVSKEQFAHARERARSMLADITVRVDYTDIYNRSQPPVERKLSWFRRDE